MTKVVIPPPQQPVVAEEPFTPPWRHHFDLTNQTLNSLTDTVTTVSTHLATLDAHANQLISVTAVTAGSTRYDVTFTPGEWSRVRLNIYGMIPASTDVASQVRIASSGTSVTTGYKYALHRIQDTTASQISGSTNAGGWPLNLLNVSTVSGLSAEINIMALTTNMASVLYRAAYLAHDTTPAFTLVSAGGMVDGYSSTAINSIVFRTSAGTFSTGSLALYGDR